jgi:tRNA(adenine34) deaminase
LKYLYFYIFLHSFALMSQKLRSHYLIVQQTLAELNYEAYLTHCRWMEYAIALAQTAGNVGEIPVAAVIIDSEGNLLAEATNHKERYQDATAHAEILALRAASQVKQSWYLKNCTLYVTLEPCPMCAGAIINSRVGWLVYGADEPKTGAIRTISNLPDSYGSNHRLKVLAGIKEESCRQQLQTWFRNKRSAQSQI